jgi:hypothetical protein
MMADGLHPEPEGSDARAQLIARGVLGCLGGAATTSAAPPSRQERPLKPRLATVDAMARREAGMSRAIGQELLTVALTALAG